LIEVHDANNNISTYSQQQLINAGFETQILSSGTPGNITSSTTGVFRGGVTLIAPSVTGDPEGITNPNYTYQWIRNGSPIDGAIGSTYSVPLAGAGIYRVAISYTDDHGFMETVDSAERDVLTGERTFDYSTSARKIAGEDRVIDRFMIQTNAASTSPWRITAFKPSEDILQIQQESAGRNTPRTLFAVQKVDAPARALTKSEQKFYKKQEKAVSKSIKRIGRTGDGFAYNQLTGELFVDTNGSKKGFGTGGGLIAVLEDTPAIGINNIQLL